MKVLVAVKRVVDYNVKVRVKADGSGVELANVKMGINPFCEIAVEEGARLREAGIASELVVVTFGPDGSYGHPDHIGGLMHDGKPAYPNARVVFGEVEFDFWKKGVVRDARKAGRELTISALPDDMREIAQVSGLLELLPLQS